MTISYRIDPELRVVFTTATGTLTDDELIAHKSALVRDPQFESGMVELSDVRAVERLLVTPEGVSRMAQMDTEDSARLDGFKLAIVVGADVVFGMSRMYQTMTSDNPLNVNIFRDMHAAREWLGLR